MSYKLKTLIVFDTNSLRKMRTNAKEREIIDYSNFGFAAPFRKIKTYLAEKKITDIIHLGVPEMVLRELINQCEKQYAKEQKAITEVLTRIAEIPNKQKITINDPDANFDYTTFIKEKVEAVIEEHGVTKIPFDDAKTPQMFKNMLEKVLDVEDVKSPFRPKDAGFKDNVIWEGLLNYEGIKDYDKVIFLTKDGDYKENCYTEFSNLWPEKDIFIRKDETQVILDIERIYGDYLSEKEIIDYAESEYFIGYLNEQLKEKTMITIDEIEEPIREYRIDAPCNSVTRLPPKEDGEENIMITSKVIVVYKWDEETREQTVEASTLLYDQETKEPISTEYDFNLQ
jgi:hypothetical protein